MARGIFVTTRSYLFYFNRKTHYLDCYEIIVIDKDICKKSAKVSRMDIRLLIKIRLTVSCENYKKKKCIFIHYLYEPLCPDLSYRFLSEHAWLLSYADLGGDPDPFPLWKFQICKMCIVKLLKIGLGPPPCKHRYPSGLHLEKNSGSTHVYVSI